jgi:hypothetical protein
MAILLPAKRHYFRQIFSSNHYDDDKTWSLTLELKVATFPQDIWEPGKHNGTRKTPRQASVICTLD